jgi:Carboxypeptidase regulatory-like domain
VLKLAVFSIVFSTLCRGQASAPDANAPKKARVEGSVANLAGEPVRRATLYLNFGELIYTAESNAVGNFVFEDIAPGRYMLTAERAGYISVQNPAWVALDPGQSMTGVSVKLTPQAIIAGRVVDEEGEPLPNAAVTLVRTVRGQDGAKQIVPVPSATTTLTDADGAFVIGNLKAGAYYVSATQPRSGALPTLHRSGEASYVPTYYPDATTVSTAVAVPVTAGGQSRGFVIRMRRVPVFRIAGKAVNAATGQPASNPSINLIPKNRLELPAQPMQAAIRDGTFEFNRVPAGTYVLEATPDGMSSDGILVGRQEVTVSRGDVENLLLPIVPATDVRGRVIVEDGSSAPLSRTTVTLNVADGANYGISGAEVGADGGFLIHGIEPASYRLDVLRLPPGTYLKAVRYGGQDVTGMPIDLSGDSAGLLDIVLSGKGGMVTGIVHDASGAPLRAALVALWNPRDPLPDLAQMFTFAVEDGRFLYPSAKPGEYKLLSFGAPRLEAADAYDWIAQFADRAVTVKVEESSQQAVDPPLVNID